MAVRDISIIPQNINKLTPNNLIAILGYPCEVIERGTQQKISNNKIMNSSNGYYVYNEYIDFMLYVFEADEKDRSQIDEDMFDVIPENNINIQQLLINWKQCDYITYMLIPQEYPKNHPKNLNVIAHPDFVKITVAICTLLDGVVDFIEYFGVGEKPGLYTANQWQALMKILQEKAQR